MQMKASCAEAHKVIHLVVFSIHIQLLHASATRVDIVLKVRRACNVYIFSFTERGLG